MAPAAGMQLPPDDDDAFALAEFGGGRDSPGWTRSPGRESPSYGAASPERERSPPAGSSSKREGHKRVRRARSRRSRSRSGDRRPPIGERALAADVRHGNTVEAVQTQGLDDAHRFAWDAASPATQLGEFVLTPRCACARALTRALVLSVDPTLVFQAELPAAEERERATLALADCLRTKEERALAALPKVYEQTDCVICIDDDAGPPDTVLCACGHRCVHAACYAQAPPEQQRRCPVCRATVVARVRLAAVQQQQQAN